MDCNVCGKMRSAGSGLGNYNKKSKPKSEVLRLCPGKPLYTTENLLTYVTHDLTHKLLEFTGVTIKVRLPMKYQITVPSHYCGNALYWIYNTFMWEFLHTHTHTQKSCSSNFKCENQARNKKIKRTFLPENFKSTNSRMWAGITKH